MNEDVIIVSGKKKESPVCQPVKGKKKGMERNSNLFYYGKHSLAMNRYMGEGRSDAECCLVLPSVFAAVEKQSLLRT